MPSGPMKIHQFGGMLPAWDDRSLPDNQAAFSQNGYLYSGAAVGWRLPKLLRALTTSTSKFAYRVPVLTQGIASADLVFVNNVEQGDTVTLGETIYTFTSTPTASYEVLLGSTALESAQNLFLAIVFGSQDVNVCGAGTVNNPAAAPNNPYLGFPFSVTGTTNTPGANMLVLMPVTPSGTQKLTDVSFMPASSSGTAKFTGVVYNNTNQIDAGGSQYINQPSTLIAQGEQVVGCVAGTAVDSHLSVPAELQGGTIYWIGFLMDSAVAMALASVGGAGWVPLGGTALNEYTAGPLNPVTGTAVEPVFNFNVANFQMWGSMALINTTDPENTIGSHNFGSGGLNYIGIDAPDFGSAYNNTVVAESTAGARTTWLSDLLELTDTTSFLVGGANQSADTTILGASTWMEFADPDTNVVRTPVVDDTYQRYYMASPSQPPQYNTYARITADDPPWLLGVPAPGCAPTINVVGGGANSQIGFFEIGDTTYDAPAQLLYLTQITTTGSCTVLDIAAQYVTDNGVASVFTGVIYSDNGEDAPLDLLQSGVPMNTQQGAYGLATVPVPTGGPIISAFPGQTYISGTGGQTATTNGTPLALLGGTKYWIGFMVQSSDIVLESFLAGTAGATATIGPNLGPPATAPVMTMGQPNIEVWMDLTGESVEETRAYVYTWVTDYGEEGPPSPPTLNDGWTNGTWEIGLFSPTADEMGVTRNITQTNLYRTISGQNGGTTYFFVDTFDVTLGTYIDAQTDNIVAENNELASTNWSPPPEGLQGMLAMPNGMIVGFKANEIWFCEPYRPHAWPPSYVMTTDFPIVGIGVQSQSVIACTQSSPAIFTGTAPANMSQIKVTFPEPCISRGSVVSSDKGVFYSSANGLILVSQSGAAHNVTQGWITRERWDALTPPENIRAVKHISTYFAFGTTSGVPPTEDTSVAQEGFTIEMSSVADMESFTIYPQPGDHRIGFSTLQAPNGINMDNIMIDPWSGVCITIQGGDVYYYDFSDPAPQIQKSLWRSKKFQGGYKDNFAAMRVWFDIPPGGPQTPPATRTETEPTFTTSPGMTFVPGMFGIVRVIADGKYVTERELRYSTELMRIASGFKATTWQWEIESVMSVTSIKASPSIKELAKVS